MYQDQQVNDSFTLLSWVVKNGIGVNLVLDMSMVRDSFRKGLSVVGTGRTCHDAEVTIGLGLMCPMLRYDFDLYWALTKT